MQLFFVFFINHTLPIRFIYTLRGYSKFIFHYERNNRVGWN